MTASCTPPPAPKPKPSPKPKPAAKPKPATFKATDVSARGLEFIGRHEGFRAAPYNDPAVPPNATIGYGHMLHRGPVTPADRAKYPKGISREQALDLLHDDARGAVTAVRKLVKVPLAQHQFDALVSFVFNCGAGAFAESTLLKRVNARRFDDVPIELAKWTRAGNVRLEGLRRRRVAESALFMTGTYGGR